jgi:hypothetical protein
MIGENVIFIHPLLLPLDERSILSSTLFTPQETISGYRGKLRHHENV